MIINIETVMYNIHSLPGLVKMSDVCRCLLLLYVCGRAAHRLSALTAVAPVVQRPDTDHNSLNKLAHTDSSLGLLQLLCWVTQRVCSSCCDWECWACKDQCVFLDFVTFFGTFSGINTYLVRISSSGHQSLVCVDCVMPFLG